MTAVPVGSAIPPRSDHEAHCALAEKLYVASRTATTDAEAWTEALRRARDAIAEALRGTSYLADVPKGLQGKGAHMLVLRHLLSPPLSQDQFALICPAWRKGTEKPSLSGAGDKGMRLEEAQAVAAVFMERRSKSLTPWLDLGRLPLKRELQRLFWAVAPLIASQQVATLQRAKAAATQESMVIDLLAKKDWIRMPSSLLDRRASLPLKHYMYKTRFATATVTPQEVDVAIGLHGTVVLAMECKVSNDRTNSVKRVNDVLKKAAAWKEHWGSFVRTAALLQGVIASRDVQRLADAGVEVFWSHDPAAFEAWIDQQTS